MGEKDKTEKYLENYNDVFVDIFNVLLFKKKWIRKNKLRSVDKESIYKAAGGDLKIQERDVLKEYGISRYLLTSLGIENQSTIDTDMPIRVMGYDYTAYRDQIEKSEKRVPVVTIVLNFSKTEWKTPLALKDILTIPKELEPYVQDYKIHVFNIAHLPKEVRNQFTSDFKIVADFIAEKDDSDYEPSNEEIKHVEAVLEFFRVFTDDKRYDKIKEGVINKKQNGGKVTMCTLLDRYEQRGIEIGMERGMERGIQQGMCVLITTCKSFHASKQETKEKIIEGFEVSESQAEQALAEYWC